MTQYFNGSTFVGSVATPAFTINKAPVRDLTLALSKSNASSVDKDKSINLQGYVIADADDDSITNDDVTIYTTLDNGNAVDSFKLNGTSSNSTEDGFFNLDLAASKLSTGDNQVSFYAVDNYGNKSNTVTTSIKLNGELAFGDISNEISFGSNEVPLKETVIKAHSDWAVNVNDNRASGSKWYVYATASALKSAAHTLAGNLVYIDGDGNKTNLTDTSVLISSGDSNTDTNIATDWDTQQGVFLDVQPNIYADSYTGSITWSLADTPAN